MIPTWYCLSGVHQQPHIKLIERNESVTKPTKHCFNFIATTEMEKPFSEDASNTKEINIPRGKIINKIPCSFKRDFLKQPRSHRNESEFLKEEMTYLQWVAMAARPSVLKPSQLIIERALKFGKERPKNSKLSSVTVILLSLNSSRIGYFEAKATSHEWISAPQFGGTKLKSENLGFPFRVTLRMFGNRRMTISGETE